MQTPSKFINWLEGYLDATKNKLNSSQIREIRKKMEDAKKSQANDVIAIYDSPQATIVNSNNPSNHEEFLREVEKNKGAATMEQLSEAAD